MIKLHDKIPATPDIGMPDCAVAALIARKQVLEAEVIYIHPQGRFYRIRFDFPGGAWTEARTFTEAELEAGKAAGMFRGWRPRKEQHPTKNVAPFGFNSAEDFISDPYPRSAAYDEDDLSAMF